MPLLQVDALSRSFQSTRALANATLTIDAGEIVALMGANGAGKSTLVKILSGVLPADSGTITLNGQAYTPRTPQTLPPPAWSRFINRPTWSVLPGLQSQIRCC